MGKISVCDKIVIENHNKRKDENRRNFYVNEYPLKDGLGVECTDCGGDLMQDGTLTSFTSCDPRHSFTAHSQ